MTWDSIPASSHLALAEGRRRRDEGHRQLELVQVFEPWHRNAERALKTLAESGTPFSSDAIHSMCGDPPRPNAVGALLAQAAKSELVEWTGDLIQSERAEARGRLLKVWRGVRR